MPTPRKIPRLQPANDRPKIAPVAQVAIPGFAPTPKSMKRMVAASVLVFSFGLLAVTMGLILFDPPASEPMMPAAATSVQPQATQQPTLHDIRLPIANLAPDAPLPDDPNVDLVAAQIGTMPVPAAERLDPADAQQILTRAHAALEVNHSDAALALYEKVLAADPDNHNALTGKIYLLAAVDDDETAIRLSRRLLKLYPDDSAAAANLAHLLMRGGNNEGAITYLDRAARQEPDQLSLRMDLATLYDRSGHKTEALMLYRQIIAVAEREDIAPLPLAAIQRRVDYLASSGEDSDESAATDGDTDADRTPSNTRPVDN